MLLKDKVAVIYGAGGAIGAATARSFAREGARVFLTGRRAAPLEAVAREIAGGAAAVAQVDALDEEAVAQHLRDVVARAGRVDISFNAVGFLDTTVIGVPMLELGLEQFVQPVAAYARSYFVTARAAARHMVAQRAGVIMTVTSLPARTGTPSNGGYGAAQAAKEALTRDLSCELSPHGIRVVGLRPQGLPETRTMREVYDRKAPAMGLSWEQFTGYLANMSHAKRVMALEEVAEMAAFAACDRASGLTGTTLNLTLGSVAD